MYQKISAYVHKHHMLQIGEKVIVGVSGGADSICLLFVLLKLKQEYKLDLLAVHVHHGLRGESADRDEQYVRKICEEWEVSLEVYHKDVRNYAREHGMTEEEAGRTVRREIFASYVKEDPKRTKIALAHHMNDNAETILFHLCRGTGPKGLGGIAPVVGSWIRPLLCVERREIESYLKKWGISYCIDETNLEDDYSRNKIRNQIYPHLEEINDKVTVHISRTAEQMQELWDYIEAEVERWKAYCTQSEEHLVDMQTYSEVPDALKSYVIHSVICQAAGRAKDIGNVHVEQVQKLFESQVGRRIQLPYEVEAVRSYRGIRFHKTSGEEVDDPKVEADKLFEFRVFEREEGMNTFPQNIYTKWFDYDIIKSTVKMRHREAGDYITIDKNGNTQRLKKYFVNQKIPEYDRDNIWLAADGSHIMWIVGYRQNQKYQITETTKQILEIKFCGGERSCQRQ